MAVTLTVADLATELGETVTVSPQPETDGDTLERSRRRTATRR